MKGGILLALCVLAVCVVRYGEAEMVFKQNSVCGTDHAHNAPRSRATVKTREGQYEPVMPVFCFSVVLRGHLI